MHTHSSFACLTIVALFGAVACASAQPKTTSTPIASTAPLPSPSTTEDTSTPPTSTDGWTSIASTKKTITLAYPVATFPEVRVGADAITLLSNLTRAGLADDGNDPEYWRFEIKVALVAGTPFDRVRQGYATYPFPDMFPNGTEASFVAQQGIADRTKINGRDGYYVWTGIEGYDAVETFVAVDTKTTLDFTCRYVGGVMGPEISEDEQTSICGAVLASVQL
jgi:hypothetical protein